MRDATVLIDEDSAIRFDVVRHCVALIRMDTTNAADSAHETLAARYVSAELSKLGLDPVWFEPRPGRTSVICRLPGSDPTLAGLLVHSHLDTVPIGDGHWSVDPFGGEIRDGMIWGRGAVNMKNVAAMMLAVVARIVRDGIPPRRDLVFAWLADEEAGGSHGVEALLEQRPDLIAGCETAIGEVGGFSVPQPDGSRGYLIEVEQKGLTFLRLTSHGAGGHGALPHDDAAPRELVAALGRIDCHEWTASADDPLGREETHDHGSIHRWLRAAATTTTNLTQLSAGSAPNVVPARATAVLDVRVLPADAGTVIEIVRELAGTAVTVEAIRDDPPTSSELSDDFASAALAALRATDPSAVLVPFRMPIGSDNRFFRRHGIRSYGFIPTPLPDDFDLAAMFHGVDERIPITTLLDGTDMLLTLVLDY